MFSKLFSKIFSKFDYTGGTGQNTSRLVSRNSRRDRKENGLFFGSLLATIVAFYIILALPRQDVMIFLSEMESDAVNKLMSIIPVFYGMALFILFFLIYYASKLRMERRKHEFGVYLMMGMRRSRLFLMLLAEDFRNSVILLAVGLPVSLLLSELISLITARLVGIGIVGHQASFSLSAMLWTAGGFFLVKFTAFLILSGKISRQEIDSLLAEMPKGEKKQLPAPLYAASLIAGIICLAIAYGMVNRGEAWLYIRQMGIAVMFGLIGTMAFFWGLRFPIGLLVKAGKHDRQLHVFHFRQVEETVIHRSGLLAVCSLLILAALCCFGSGVSIAGFYGRSEPHVLDYTFMYLESREEAAAARQKLADFGLDSRFSDLFEMKVGMFRSEKEPENALNMDSLLSVLEEMQSSGAGNQSWGYLESRDSLWLIPQSSYNRLLAAAGMPELELAADEAAIYADSEFSLEERNQMLNRALETRPEAMMGGKVFYLTGPVQTINLVTDRSITLIFALIVPDKMFEYYTQGSYEIYLNGVLDKGAIEKGSLMSAISDMNKELNKTGLSYESYLQNMGRQLFYMVSASYITIYLAVIFLIIANTIIGVQFLMGQQNVNRRYRTLIRLGASYENLCGTARRQINWYFGIPTAVAACSSVFGVRALLTGLLSADAKENFLQMTMLSMVLILGLCVLEYSYIAAVKHYSDRYLLTLMEMEREE